MTQIRETGKRTSSTSKATREKKKERKSTNPFVRKRGNELSILCLYKDTLVQ